VKRLALVLAAAAIVVAVLALILRRGGAEKGTRPPKTSSELPTTSAEIYLGNLDGQIAELARLKDAGAATASNAQRLSAALYTRARYKGDLDEIQRAIDEASTCIQLEDTNGPCFVIRAEEEQSLHRFAEARADVDRAKALGGRTADLEADLAWNAGRYDEAIEAIRKARRERPSSATWLREAQLDHDLGLEDDADAAFAKAEDLIRDVAPLPLAHLYVQRGIVLGERGRRDEACVFYRAAIARMPGYVAAHEHLAETLHALGKDAEAITIYEGVGKASDDTEFM
jgi:tetratricopeptide (TPR) repeat protein